MLISNVGFNPQVKRQNTVTAQRQSVKNTDNTTFGLFSNGIKNALKKAGITDKTILNAFGSLNGTIDTAPFCRYERFEGLLEKPTEQLRLAVEIVEDIILNKREDVTLLKYLRGQSQIFKEYAKIELPSK